MSIGSIFTFKIVKVSFQKKFIAKYIYSNKTYCLNCPFADKKSTYVVKY